MLHDPRVRKLSFTGSTEVGRILLREAADTVVNCSMELGGNAPFVVLDDADLDAAVEGALVAKMRNAGEACAAADRFYVHESIAAGFAEWLAAAMGALHVGNGLAPGLSLYRLFRATHDRSRSGGGNLTSFSTTPKSSASTRASHVRRAPRR